MSLNVTRGNVRMWPNVCENIFEGKRNDKPFLTWLVTYKRNGLGSQNVLSYIRKMSPNVTKCHMTNLFLYNSTTGDDVGNELTTTCQEKSIETKACSVIANDDKVLHILT